VNAITIHAIGASGRTGAALCSSLLADAAPFVPVVRDAAKWSALGLGCTPVVADITDGVSLRRALSGATRIVCCAHARHAGAVLAAAPPDARFVFIGSTRKFTRWPDEHGSGVIAGETALLASGRSGVMLHPTMIYGASGENNVQRLAAVLRRLPLVPLPRGAGMVQPIHQDDVTRAIRAALTHGWDGPAALVIAGPGAVSYADFVRAVARAAGLRAPRFVPVPLLLLRGLALAGAAVRLPRIRGNEIRRLGEDKAFDIEAMRAVLGVEPVPLAEGLARTFGRPHKSG
jgi:uncharacterized protein YbjT (DUF2867 family)